MDVFVIESFLVIEVREGTVERRKSIIGAVIQVVAIGNIANIVVLSINNDISILEAYQLIGT